MLTSRSPSPSATLPGSPDSQSPSPAPDFAPDLNPIIAAVEKILIGKPHTVRLALAGLLAQGHLLIEDLPGVGKTTLAHALAGVFGLQFTRVQFTSDLLPADILGTSLYDRETQSFRFVPGPVFAQVLLADEINRATPKTQSALLEAMEEGQVSVDGTSHPLPSPFFVIATQNPTHQIGTFPLPESQLDRFLMRLEIGYPDAGAERELLASGGRSTTRSSAPLASMSPRQLQAHQQAAARVHASPSLVDYVQKLLAESRRTPDLAHGLSPRAGLALLGAARAWAYLAGRSHVVPEDVQTVFPAVARHRLARGGGGGFLTEGEVRALIERVPLL